jgi:hypothetical protein
MIAVENSGRTTPKDDEQMVYSFNDPSTTYTIAQSRKKKLRTIILSVCQAYISIFLV